MLLLGVRADCAEALQRRLGPFAAVLPAGAPATERDATLALIQRTLADASPAASAGLNPTQTRSR